MEQAVVMVAQVPVRAYMVLQALPGLQVPVPAVVPVAAQVAAHRVTWVVHLAALTVQLPRVVQVQQAVQAR